MVVTRGLLDAPDYLNMVASHPSQAQLAALLVLVMGLPLAMVSVMMFPILKRQNEALAIGYVVFRGALETLTYIGVATCWLLLRGRSGDLVAPTCPARNGHSGMAGRQGIQFRHDRFRQ